MKIINPIDTIEKLGWRSDGIFIKLHRTGSIIEVYKYEDDTISITSLDDDYNFEEYYNKLEFLSCIEEIKLFLTKNNINMNKFG